MRTEYAAWAPALAHRICSCSKKARRFVATHASNATNRPLASTRLGLLLELLLSGAHPCERSHRDARFEPRVEHHLYHAIFHSELEPARVKAMRLHFTGAFQEGQRRGSDCACKHDIGGDVFLVVEGAECKGVRLLSRQKNPQTSGVSVVNKNVGALTNLSQSCFFRSSDVVEATGITDQNSPVRAGRQETALESFER